MSTVQFGYARNERIYLLREDTYGVTPATSGIANLTGANCCNHISVSLDPMVDLYDSEYKTGSRGMIPGQPGRRVGNFKLTLPLKGNGTPGVPPDYAPILLSAFGAQTITNGAAVGYSIVDNPATTFSMYRFRQPSGLYQQLGISCIPTRCVWNIGQNMANWSVEGDCFWVLDSEQFNTADSFARGGLITFPTEPINPVTNGVQSQGFVGTIAANSTTIANIQTMTITAEWGWSQNRTTFGRYYPSDVLGGMRRITATVDSFDDNSSVLQALRSFAISKYSVTLNAFVGNVPGNQHSFALHNCQLSFPEMTEASDRFAQRFQTIVAHESVPGSKDEFFHTLF